MSNNAWDNYILNSATQFISIICKWWKQLRDVNGGSFSLLVLTCVCVGAQRSIELDFRPPVSTGGQSTSACRSSARVTGFYASQSTMNETLDLYTSTKIGIYRWVAVLSNNEYNETGLKSLRNFDVHACCRVPLPGIEQYVGTAHIKPTACIQSRLHNVWHLLRVSS